MKGFTTDEKRARQREYSRRSYYKNLEESRAKHRLRAREWRRKNPKKADFKLRQHEAQAGRPKPACCEVCGAKDRRIHFDHCHQRDVFRGWLCTNCNTILGMANDDPNILRMAIAYLERTKSLVPPQLELPL